MIDELFEIWKHFSVADILISTEQVEFISQKIDFFHRIQQLKNMFVAYAFLEISKLQLESAKIF